MHFTYEKWVICNVVLKGITYETRAALESMCHGSMCSLDFNDICDLFEFLAWYQWHYENAIESFVCPTPISYDLRTYSPLMCSYYQSFDYDASSYLYYDISNAC